MNEWEIPVGDNPYNRLCPICGCPSITRERRANGDDFCRNNHRYPSRPPAMPNNPPVNDKVRLIGLILEEAKLRMLLEDVENRIDKEDSADVEVLRSFLATP